MTNVRLQHKFENFSRRLDRLEEASTYELSVGLNLDGLIQRFEFPLELGWKLIKAYLEDKGDDVPIHSSKDAVRRTFTLSIIHEPNLWLKMINDRNFLSHAYDEKEALSVGYRIVNDYLKEFEKLRKIMASLIN